MKIQKIDMIALLRLSDDEKIRLRNKARDLLKLNFKVTQITDIMCLSQCATQEILAYKPQVKAYFGYKYEAYFTENEMIEGYQIPNYEELSESEKIIFNMK